MTDEEKRFVMLFDIHLKIRRYDEGRRISFSLFRSTFLWDVIAPTHKKNFQRTEPTSMLGQEREKSKEKRIVKWNFIEKKKKRNERKTFSHDSLNEEME